MQAQGLETASTFLHTLQDHSNSGRSAAWLAHLTGGQGVGGSNPLVPTIFKGLTDLSVVSFFMCVNFMLFRILLPISNRCHLITRSMYNPLYYYGFTKRNRSYLRKNYSCTQFVTI